MFNKVYVINNEYEKLTNNSEYIYINYDKALWLRIDSIGERIIQKCDGVKSLHDIIIEISEEFGIESELIMKSCTEFLKKVIHTNVLHEDVKSLNEEVLDDNIEHNDEIEKEEDQSYPNAIWLHVTGNCNLNCDFCYSKSGSRVNDKLEVTEIVHFCQQIPKERRKDIIISGGEPFIYKDLEELLKILKVDLGFEYIALITNGTIGIEKYKNIVDFIDSIQFSVDGPNKEIHDRSRGNGSFDKLMLSIKEAERLNIKTRILSFTPTVKNITYLKDMVYFAFKHKINKIHITKFMPVGRGMESTDNLDITQSQFDKEISKFYDEYKRVMELIRVNRDIYEVGVEEEMKSQYIQVSMGGDISKKVIDAGRKYSCGVGKGIMSINYNGYIYGCPSLHHDEFKLGSLSDNILDIIAKGTELNDDLAVNNKKSDCYRCKYKYFCGGGCKAIALAYEGVYSEYPGCEYQRVMIDKSISTMN